MLKSHGKLTILHVKSLLPLASSRPLCLIVTLKPTLNGIVPSERDIIRRESVV